MIKALIMFDPFTIPSKYGEYKLVRNKGVLKWRVETYLDDFQYSNTIKFLYLIKKVAPLSGAGVMPDWIPFDKADLISTLTPQDFGSYENIPR